MKIYPKKNISFAFKDAPGKKVFVAGTFNNWDPNVSQLADPDQTGAYAVTLRIPRGSHEYKFIVDGIWQADPVNPDCVINGCGSMNSLVIV